MSKWYDMTVFQGCIAEFIDITHDEIRAQEGKQQIFCKTQHSKEEERVATDLY